MISQADLRTNKNSIPKAPGMVAVLATSSFSLGLFGLLILNYGFQMIRFPPCAADGDIDVCGGAFCVQPKGAERL